MSAHRQQLRSEPRKHAESEPRSWPRGNGNRLVWAHEQGTRPGRKYIGKALPIDLVSEYGKNSTPHPLARYNVKAWGHRAIRFKLAGRTIRLRKAWTRP